MEIIIGLLIVAVGIWYIFFRDVYKDTKITEAAVVPQNEEAKPEVAPVVEAGPAKCGCGRSPTGFCVGLHKLSTDEWAVHADNPNMVIQLQPTPAPAVAPEPAPVVKAPAKKPAAKKTAGAKPAAKPATNKPAARATTAKKPASASGTTKSKKA